MDGWSDVWMDVGLRTHVCIDLCNQCVISQAAGDGGELSLIVIEYDNGPQVHWFHWTQLSLLSGRLVHLDKADKVVQSPGFVSVTRLTQYKRFTIVHPAVGATMRKGKAERETMQPGADSTVFDMLCLT